MRLLDYFTRRPDGRMEPPADLSEIERQLNDRLAKRKAARLEKNPHRRGWIIRKLNGGA